VNIEAGENFLRTFARRCQQLVSFPYSGRNYDELETGLRGLPLDGYIILYRTIESGGIEIARIINGRQDLDKLFDRE
jgi:toxin ParE1/3/4